MKQMARRASLAFIVAAILALPPAGGFALDLGKTLKKAADQVEKDVKDEVKKTLPGQEEPATPGQSPSSQDSAPPENQAADASPKAPPVIFSKSPINPASPADLTTTFKAGDPIYSLVRVDKPFREIYKVQDGSLEFMVFMTVDGQDDQYQYITLTAPADMNGRHFVLDIAPELDKMTAYRDPAVKWGKGKANNLIGPMAFTAGLAKLAPGKHEIEIKLRHYGDINSLGAFTIEGGDYSAYAKRHEEIKAFIERGATLPEFQMANKELEEQMRALLKNAGWENILTMGIVDKDWWLDRASGGDSPIVARHIAAAVAAKDAAGACHYKIVTFQQPKLITGEWGALEIQHTADARPVPCENIKK